MALTSTPRRAGPYAGTGTLTPYPFAFKVFSPTDVQVTVTDPQGLELDATFGTDYTVALHADQDAQPGGSVAMVRPVLAGYSVTLTSRVPYDQPMVLTNLGGFYPEVLNDNADRQGIQIQQLLEWLSRTLSMPVGSELTYEQLLDMLTEAQAWADQALAIAGTVPPAYDTAAALRAAGTPAGIAYATTGGALAAGDGGGGTWRWDASGTADDNTGTVLLPTGHVGAGRWKRVFSGPIRAEWGGLSADRSTDDSAVFQAAIDEASAKWVAGGSLERQVEPVLIPPGAYALDTTLTLPRNVVLVAEAREMSVELLWRGAGPCITTDQTPVRMRLLATGSGYTDGTYSVSCAESLTGIDRGTTASVTVSSGAIASVTLVNAGAGHIWPQVADLSGIPGGSGGIAISEAEQTRHVGVKGLRIIRDDATDSINGGILLCADRATVSECYLTNFAGPALWLAGGNAADLRRIQCYEGCAEVRDGNITAGLPLGAITIMGFDHALYWVNGSTSSTGAQPEPTLELGGLTFYGANHFVSSCVGELSNIGCIQYDEQSHHVGCRYDLNRSHGHLMRGRVSSVNGCRALRNNLDDVGAHGFMHEGRRNQYTGCTAYSIPGDGAVHVNGFYDAVDFGDQINAARYSGCRSTSQSGTEFDAAFAPGGIVAMGWQGSPGELVTVSNTGNDSATPSVASASVLSVRSAATTTTFTDLADGQEGQQVVIQILKGGTTWTHGAGIYWSDGADWTPASGAARTVMRINGAWYQV